MSVDYRSLLFDELRARRGRRPSYSLRAFSRDLGLSPSHLNELFAKKKNLSEAKVSLILERVQWSQRRKQMFWLSFKRQCARRESLRIGYDRELARLSGDADPRALSQNEFYIIADWYHFAIVELLRLKNADTSEAGLARRLGLERKVVRQAIARLAYVGMVKVNGDAITVISDFYSSGDIPSKAIQRNHEQHLKLAALAQSRQAFEQRDFSGATFICDPARLPEAKKMICEFRRQLMRFLESGENKRVYRLSVQLFALDKEEEGDLGLDTSSRGR